MPHNLCVGRLLRQKGLRDQPDARERMVRELAGRGIHDRAVLEAMGVIPRHAFVPPHLLPWAYACRTLCVGKTSLTDPYCVALMIQALGLMGGEKVLEVGTGSGYQTALLAMLSRKVFTIDRIRSLATASLGIFETLGLRSISARWGDGYEGWPEAAPFDAVLVSAAAPTVPRVLVQQLHPREGRMVIPVGPKGGRQRLLLVRRQDQATHGVDLGPTCFMPLVPCAPGSARLQARCRGAPRAPESLDKCRGQL